MISLFNYPLGIINVDFTPVLLVKNKLISAEG